MHLKNLVFPAALLTAVGYFAIPAHGSQASPAAVESGRAKNTGNVMIAEEIEDKAQGKVNEMHDMGSGAANAVEEKHEEHEAAEASPHHHSLKHKVKGKMHEVKGEAAGAAGAVEDAHHEHEQAEHE